MCVNDLIVQGAKPLFFLDYIAVGKLNLKITKKIIKRDNNTDVTCLIVVNWRNCGDARNIFKRKI